MFGVPVMRFRLKIGVWDSGLGFKFGIQVSDSGLECRVWDSGLRFRLGLKYGIHV